MNPKKITEREFSIPMLAIIATMMNDAADLNLSLSTLIVVGTIACIYAGLRVWQKIMAMKYGYAIKPVELPPKPAPPTP